MTTTTKSSDVLLLGATGFTGTLITRYLCAHPQRHLFTFAIGARSQSKLDALVQKLDVPSSVQLVQVDVTDKHQVEEAVKSTRVIINTVGPYWKWGTPVVAACVRNGVHYVDLTGETPWVKYIINRYDYYATITGSIIVPQCGYDSIPSDISAFLANKTLKAHSPSLNLGTSTTAHKIRGGVSGGTLASAMTAIEEVPRYERKEASLPHSLSPIVGVKPSRPQFWYNLPIPGANEIYGAFFFMQPTNRALVQRTAGLLELEAIMHGDRKEAQLERYGSNFSYDEFVVMPSKLVSTMVTTAFVIGVGMLVLVRPFRWLVKKLMPQPGEGPSEEQMRNGFMQCTNLAVSDSSPPVHVQSVVKGHGDPGYSLTAIMISESALSIILPPPSQTESLKTRTEETQIHNLGVLARQGGVLTSMTAFGDVLIKRLEETGKFEFSSCVVEEGEARKGV